MTDILAIISEPGVHSRNELQLRTGFNDRRVRSEIEQLRREGKPILSLHSGGYKIAETDDERKMMLAMHKRYALSALKTYSMLLKNMAMPGQVDIDTIIEEIENGARRKRSVQPHEQCHETNQNEPESLGRYSEQELHTLWRRFREDADAAQKLADFGVMKLNRARELIRKWERAEW